MLFQADELLQPNAQVEINLVLPAGNCRTFGHRSRMPRRSRAHRRRTRHNSDPRAGRADSAISLPARPAPKGVSEDIIQGINETKFCGEQTIKGKGGLRAAFLYHRRFPIMSSGEFRRMPPRTSTLLCVSRESSAHYSQEIVANRESPILTTVQVNESFHKSSSARAPTCCHELWASTCDCGCRPSSGKIRA